MQIILGDPGAVSRDDRMFVVNPLDLTLNFHHEHSNVPTNCPWVYEDVCRSFHQGWDEIPVEEHDKGL